MKKIIVPTDFSEYADYAVYAACSIAKKNNDQVVLLHVIDEPEDSVEKSKKLDRILNLPELKEVTHHYKQVLGDPVQSILQEEADLIVMGTQGARGLKSFFIGTNTEKVAKHAECPVLVVKFKTDLKKIKSIVHPTDMRNEQSEIVEELKKLQNEYDCHVHLIKVIDTSLTNEEEVEKRLKEYAEFHQIKDYSVTAVYGIDQADSILRFAEDLNADLIVMATHDRHGLESLLGGYISGEVINKSRVAIYAKSIH